MHLKTMKRNHLCLIGYMEDQEVFTRPEAQVLFEALFHTFDSSVTIQFFRSFRHVRINFSNALAAAEAQAKLHNSKFNGKVLRLHFAQSVYIGSPHLVPPKPDKQFLISPPASPPVDWEQAQDATPVINYDLLSVISNLGPGEKYELHSGTATTPSVVVHICGSDQVNTEGPEEGKPSPTKTIQTEYPDYPPSSHQREVLQLASS
ncbi:calcipressin-1-like [Arapaima gigas]